MATDPCASLRRGITPLLLLLPGGAWLIVFFAVPMAFMLLVSLQQGTFDTGYQLTWNFGIYPEVITQYWELYVRSAVFALMHHRAHPGHRLPGRLHHRRSAAGG